MLVGQPATPPAVEPPEPIPFQYEFVLTGAWVVSLARVLALRWYRSPFLYLLAFGVMALGIAIMVLAEPVAIFGLAVILVGFGVLLAPLTTSRSRRLRPPKSFVPGEVLRTGFGDDEFVTSDRNASGRIRYAAYERLAVRGEFVVLRLQGLRRDLYYPVALFPASARAKFAAAGVKVRDRNSRGH